MPVAAGRPTTVDSSRAWLRDAACAQVDPQVFFDLGEHGAMRAKQICAGCAVVVDCLYTAMTRDRTSGVWGGLDELERRKLGGRLRGRTITRRQVELLLRQRQSSA